MFKLDGLKVVSGMTTELLWQKKSHAPIKSILKEVPF